MIKETYGYGGFLVERRLIDRGLVRDVQAEHIALLSILPDYPVDQLVGSEVPARSYVMASILRHVPATVRTLAGLGIRNPGANITVNFQPPGAKQAFHIDSPRLTLPADSIAVVHCADGGGFDFAPDAGTQSEAERVAQRIELGAGDVVFQMDKFIFHRGVNLSDETRVTLAVPIIREY